MVYRLIKCTSFIVSLLFFVQPVFAFELKWGSAPAGGLWGTVGAAMVEHIKEKNPDISGTSLPGPGGHNFLGIQSGRFNFAFATVDASTFAWKGEEVYKGKSYQGFRNVASFFPHACQFLVWADSGIETISDLKGKRITYGVRGSGSELNVRKVLELNGVLDSVRFEYLSFADAGNRMKDRQLDGFFLNSVVPFPPFMDLANTRPIRLIELSEDTLKNMLAWNEGLEAFTVPADSYPGIKKPVKGYAYRMHLIVAEDVPEEIVYRVTKTIAEDLERYANVTKALSGLTVKDMARKQPIPFHTGALKYYKELKLF